MCFLPEDKLHAVRDTKPRLLYDNTGQRVNTVRVLFGTFVLFDAFQYIEHMLFVPFLPAFNAVADVECADGYKQLEPRCRRVGEQLPAVGPVHEVAEDYPNHQHKHPKRKTEWRTHQVTELNCELCELAGFLFFHKRSIPSASGFVVE